jgi:hypothetical protein
MRLLVQIPKMLRKISNSILLKNWPRNHFDVDDDPYETQMLFTTKRWAS